MKNIFLYLVLILTSTTVFAQEQQYKITLIRANPGDLLEVIDLIKEDIDNHEELGIDSPFLLRHSQGAQWDLMLIYPIENLTSYFSEESMMNRTASNTLEKSYGETFYDLISFQEEAIVEGPDKKLFEEWFEEYNLFHVEIFTALAGKQEELLKQREMENIFYDNYNHRPNFIFKRAFGPSWDIFTIGVYKDMEDFAVGVQVTPEEQDKAAKDAGFDGIDFIGSYLRELLLEHYDTFANKVN